MPEQNKSRHDKLKLAAKVLFELPPAETLPVFKRLSIDNVKILLDQIKRETPEGRGPVANRTSSREPMVERPPSDRQPGAHDLLISDLKEHESSRILDMMAPPQVDDQTSSSLAGMDRLATLKDEEIRAILKHCDTSYWAPALKNAPVAIQQKIINCMAPTAAGLLKLEIDKLGDVSDQNEKRAREGIEQTVFCLATTGQIMIERPSRDVA